MKNIILLISVLVVGACASMPTMKSVAGTYEIKIGENTFRMVLLGNGISEGYKNGKKDELEHKWSISKEGELHVTDPNGDILVCRINKDGSITQIAGIPKYDGKTNVWPKEFQTTLKKIK